MKNLIWKQWQESKTHLLMFSSWMILAVFYAIAYELGHQFHAVVGSFSSSAMFYAVVAAIVLATRASLGEQTDGTLSFTTSLPVSMRRLATVRIVGAILTLAIPILIAAFILAGSLTIGLVEQAEPYTSKTLDPANYVEMPVRRLGTLFTSLEQLVSVTTISIFGGVELLLIVSLFGCWLSNQARAGFLGVVLALGFGTAAELLWHGERWPLGQMLYGVIIPQSLEVHWGVGGSTGSYSDHELALYRWLALGLAIPLLMLIARWFVIRYGTLAHRNPKQSRYRFALPLILSRIPMPLPTRWIALIWLELRQSFPLAFYGLLIAILISVVGKLNELGPGQDFATSLRSDLPHSVFFVGMLWAVVVASSLYSADLDSKLGSFRRSRPISQSMWFWNKFLVGLAALLLVMDGATILVSSWNAPRRSMTEGMSYAYIACFPMIHALMYSLAVLGTCMFRRPLIGGISAILLYAIVTMAITSFHGTMHLEPIDIYNRLLSAERAGGVDFRQHGYPLVYGILAVSTVVFSMASYRLSKPLQPRFSWFRRCHSQPLR